MLETRSSLYKLILTKIRNPQVMGSWRGQAKARRLMLYHAFRMGVWATALLLLLSSPSSALPRRPDRSRRTDMKKTRFCCEGGTELTVSPFHHHDQLVGPSRGGGAIQIQTNPLARAVTFLAKDIGESKAKSWIVLLWCILNETGATTLAKAASVSNDPRKFVGSVLLYNASLMGFSLSLKQIDVSIAYAVWSALGTGIVTLAGITLFGEDCDSVKVLYLLLILAGVIGLNTR